MCGRLATWLRALGLDAVYLGHRLAPEERTRLCQGRVFITRHRRLRIGETIALSSDDPFAQLAETARRLGFERAALKPFSRCLRCNAMLEEATRTEVSGRVPEYILATQPSFRRCPSCRRVYWAGDHRRRMHERLEEIMRRPEQPHEDDNRA